MTSSQAGPAEDSVFASAIAGRYAMQFFEKLERYEVQESLAAFSTHWYLSSDEYKIRDPPIRQPKGIISELHLEQNDGISVFLVPFDPDLPELSVKEVHQIVRDLVVGIYALNQVPVLTLEANFDQSTSCQMPPAFIDTRLGNLMIKVDYMMKALWHGAYFPLDQRLKFSERWRSNLDVNTSTGKPQTKKHIITEFTTAGMKDITQEAGLKGIYEGLKQTSEFLEDRKLMMEVADDLSLQMVFSQCQVEQHKNLFIIDADYTISGVLRDVSDRLDYDKFERVLTRLQEAEAIITANLEVKAEVREALRMVKIASFLTPFLIAMKKRMAIPDITQLLNPMPGEDCKTERDLPPLMMSKDFACPNFDLGNRYFHLHGGINFDLEPQPIVQPTNPAVSEQYFKLILEATKELNFANELSATIDASAEVHPVPTVELGDKKYYIFGIAFETFYPQSPPKPLWVHCYYDKIKELRLKRLPVTEVQIHDELKKRFSNKKAGKFKSNVYAGLKTTSQRGLAACFQTLARKCPGSRLSNWDEEGFSFIHYAAIHNRPHIITIMAIQGVDLNLRCASKVPSAPTPLHLAARCGSLEAAECLLSYKVEEFLTDTEGWAPIHHAAYYGHAHLLKLFIRYCPDLLEYDTSDKWANVTPLLLGATSGSLEVVKTAIELGAIITKISKAGNNMVHLATLHFHTNILRHLIQAKYPQVPVWKILVGMLNSGVFDKMDSAVRCLEILTSNTSTYWEDILAADGVPALVGLLSCQNEEMESVAASVLCNVSEHDPVRRAVTAAGAIPVLIRMAGSPLDEAQARSAILLSDLASVDDNQTLIADAGGIPAVVQLLDSEMEDVLVHAVNTVRVLCLDHPPNQTAVAQHGGILPLIEFLSSSSDENEIQIIPDILQAGASAAMAALTSGHRDNQQLAVSHGAVIPLVTLVKGHNMKVQVKAASALEALAQDNPQCQEVILKLEAHKSLIKLLKMWAEAVKEQGACALWALAGHTPTQQKRIAQHIGITLITEMLLLKSEKLQYVGAMAMMAMSRDSLENQTRIKEENGISPLVLLLRAKKTPERVKMTVIRTLGTLCVGVAHRNNRVTQGKIAEEKTISTLVRLMVKSPNELVKVEVATTLADITLCHKENQNMLHEEPTFSFRLVTDLFKSTDEIVRLKAGTALATFAFNNTFQQYVMREMGGVRINIFNPFLQSENETYQAHAAFQIVVLARVITDRDQVSLTADGVTRLVELLTSDEENTVILAARLLSSLAHTRAGIPDAMVTSGAVEILISHLGSPNDQVGVAAAVALGYLSYNRTASRKMLVACRSDPKLYQLLTSQLGRDAKICKDFTGEFKVQQTIGLPSQSLEVNGGPSINRPYSSLSVRRPKTSMGATPSTKVLDSPSKTRAISAPVRRIASGKYF